MILGEAQLAEIVDPASGESIIVFNGRSRLKRAGVAKFPRGLARSSDGGVTFSDVGFSKTGTYLKDPSRCV